VDSVQQSLIGKAVIDLTAIIPVRNAEMFLTDCLESISRANVRETIVVDGNSSDRTVEIAREFTPKVLSDEGQGVAAARAIGARQAESPNVALIDVDIVLPDTALERLFSEFESGGYAALQAGLISTSGNGYWGRALVFHHNNGRSKNWPGVMATIFRKDVLLRYGFDEWFKSGEDIELRWRLRRGTEKMGVSRTVTVSHRFDDTFSCALGQFRADGEGLARMVLKYRIPALKLLGIPLAGALRGIAISLKQRQPEYVLYFLVYGVMNYVAMIRTLLTTRYPGVDQSPETIAPSGIASPDDAPSILTNG
jgi:glycosyltransferase involved in cell wall biosynthesis